MLKSRDITLLQPVVTRATAEFLRRCEAQGLLVLITETLRDKEYQNSLYAQGRTKAGAIITQCSGNAGNESPHQFGIAFDICKNIRGQEYNDNNFFASCGAIWTAMGGTWGGNWTGFVDKPHFEFTNGQGYAPFRNGYKFPTDFKMKWELETPPATVAPVPKPQPVPVCPECTKKLINDCFNAHCSMDMMYWSRVLVGQIEPNPEYVEVLKKRLQGQV